MKDMSKDLQKLRKRIIKPSKSGRISESNPNLPNPKPI